jgi:hypothetical protein
MLKRYSFSWASLIVMGLTVVFSDAKADESDQVTSACQDLLTQQWQALSKGDENAANIVFHRARQEGCLQPPVSTRLCNIPAEQEVIHDVDGNTALVNIARSQQRLLGCEM